MPSFFQKDGCYFVTYITGPQHVLLGLRVVTNGPKEVLISNLPPIGTCSHGSIAHDKLRESVISGVDDANRECGSAFRIAEIIYVENDSPAYAIFRQCAALLVQRLARGEEFPPASPA